MTFVLVLPLALCIWFILCAYTFFGDLVEEIMTTPLPRWVLFMRGAVAMVTILWVFALLTFASSLTLAIIDSFL